MDLYQPVYQGRPDRLVQLLLSSHIRRIGVPLGLRSQHGRLDLRTELGHVVHIVQRAPVSPADVLEDLVLTSLFIHLLLLR